MITRKVPWLILAMVIGLSGALLAKPAKEAEKAKPAAKADDEPRLCEQCKARLESKEAEERTQPTDRQATARQGGGFGHGAQAHRDAQAEKESPKAEPADEPRGPGRGMGRGQGRGPGGGRGPGNGGGPPAGMRDAMDTFHSLLDNHTKIDRKVEEIPGGVMTVTTSKDKEVRDLLRKHVRQMKQRMEDGQPIRMWDPLFVELFKHREEVQMRIEDIDGGVRVSLTSDDDNVVKLVRQHAKTVSEFAKEGYDRAHEESPLPKGYKK